MSAIRVVVVDDHTLVRRGIVSLLQAQPHLEVVGEASSGEEALRLIPTLHPDVVLMDIGMPGMDGLEVTRRLRAVAPKTKVLILTVHDREDYLFQALRAGAAGYILKGADVADLLSAVQSVHQGGVYLYPTVTRRLLADYLLLSSFLSRMVPMALPHSFHNHGSRQILLLRTGKGRGGRRPL